METSGYKAGCLAGLGRALEILKETHSSRTKTKYEQGWNFSLQAAEELIEAEIEETQ